VGSIDTVSIIDNRRKETTVGEQEAGWTEMRSRGSKGRSGRIILPRWRPCRKKQCWNGEVMIMTISV
jgi:hypothetical protein